MQRRQDPGRDSSARSRGAASTISPGKVSLTSRLQRFARGTEAAPAVPPEPAAGGGEPLPAPVQRKMNGAFGADFSDVRVHQDDRAASVGAQAYASGSDLHFAPGQYDPRSETGQTLIAHELSHVVQQREGRVGGEGVVTDQGLEAEADEQGARVARSEPVATSGAAPIQGKGIVQRSAPAEATDGPAAGIDPSVAKAVLLRAGFCMLRFGTLLPAESTAAEFDDALDTIRLATGDLKRPVEERSSMFDSALGRLEPARAAASDSERAQFDADVSVARDHLKVELAAGGLPSGDPAADVVAARVQLARVGGVGVEASKAISAANAKTLVGMGKRVEWADYAIDLAENLDGTVDPKWTDAATSLRAGQVDVAFAIVDQVLALVAAGQGAAKLPPAKGEPVAEEDVSKCLKAALDFGNAALGTMLQCMRAVATACATAATDPAQAKELMATAESLGKGASIVGGGFSTFASVLDLGIQSINLINASNGAEAADAAVGVAKATAGILGSGSQLLIELGLASEAGVAGTVAAVATPLAVAIPVSWMVFKTALMELGATRTAITGALMAGEFDACIAIAESMRGPSDRLDVALMMASASGEDDPALLEVARDCAAQLRGEVEQMMGTVGGFRSNVLKREMLAVIREADLADQTEPAATASAARGIAAGVGGILARAGELVTEETGIVVGEEEEPATE